MILYIYKCIYYIYIHCIILLFASPVNPCPFTSNMSLASFWGPIPSPGFLHSSTVPRSIGTIHGLRRSRGDICHLSTCLTSQKCVVGKLEYIYNIYIYIYTYTVIYIYICMYVCIYIYVHIYIYIYTCIYIYIYIHERRIHTIYIYTCLMHMILIKHDQSCGSYPILTHTHFVKK